MEQSLHPEFYTYLNQFPQNVKNSFLMVVECIYEAVPAASQLMNYGIPAFALVPNGKREEQIMVGAFKKHIGFYPHPTTIEYFKDQLTNYKWAKGSIQFPLNQDMPKDLIIAMVKYRKQLIDISKQK